MAETGDNFRLTRREFIKSTLGGAAALTLGGGISLGRPSAAQDRHVRRAKYFNSLDDNLVQCILCPNKCSMFPGFRGKCGVRENRDGVLYTLVFGRPCSVHIDPIEKKPLFHFLPGTSAFSIATAGCNMRCLFCQNWQISQRLPEETSNVDLPPEDVVKYAVSRKCSSIAYTYTEPTVFYEYMLETAKIARRHGIKNVLKTCGKVNIEPLKELLQYADAANVDLKGFDEKFYREICFSHLQPVLDVIKFYHRTGTWLEITNLVIPTLNDSDNFIRKLCGFVRDELSYDVPIHFSRFYPTYKLTNLPRTPVETVERACRIARKMGLRYVYSGNVPGHIEESTRCHSCGELLIHRVGYMIQKNLMQNGQVCPFCGTTIAGVWQ